MCAAKLEEGLSQLDQVSKFKELYQLDGTVKGTIKAALETWKHQRLIKLRTTNTSEDVDKYAHLLGSTSEGTFSARFFAEENFTLEFDIMIEVMLLPNDILSEILEPVAGKTGYYRMRKDDRMVGYLVDLIKDKKKEFDEIMSVSDKYVSGLEVKNYTKKVAKFKDDKDFFTSVTAAVMGGDVDEYTVEIKSEFNGPAYTLLLQLKHNGNNVILFSVDIVSSARISIWPPESHEWFERKRKWPPSHVIDEIKEYDLHLVAKQSAPGEEHYGEWRLCFVPAEQRIIQERTPVMNLTYYLFKILIYAHLKTIEVNGESISSYLGKTTMMYACEELDPEDWTEENLSQNLTILLLKLFSYIESGHMPHYFVKEIDLLSNHSTELISRIKGIDKTKLISDPMSCIPQNMDKVRDTLNLLNEKLQLLTSVMSFANFGFIFKRHVEGEEGY